MANVTPAKGLPGQPKTVGDRVSLIAAEAIKPGKLVVVTVDNEATCELPNATGEVTGGRALGIAIRDRHLTDSDLEYQAGDEVLIQTSGEVWVTTEAAAVSGGKAYVRFSATGAEELGSFRDDADTSDAVALPGAVFSSTAGDGEAISVKLGALV